MSTQARVAVVTGAAQGMGRAICHRLAAGGMRVAAVDIADAGQTVAELSSAGVALRCDVTSPDEVDALHAAVVEQLGPCAVLVNNVGIYPPTAFADITFEEWRRVQSVNVDSVFLMSKAFAPAMAEAGWGRIINIGSAITMSHAPDLLPYMTSKAAVHGLTRALCNELGPRGVTVNAVAPSIVPTEGVFARSGGIGGMTTEEELAFLVSLQTVKRSQRPEDVAEMVGFLAGDAGEFITGQVLHVDGGLTRSGG